MNKNTHEERMKRRELLGFRDGEKGTHSARTIMLEELGLLLDHAGDADSVAEFRRLVVEENLLGKPTHVARARTASNLQTLYGLDRDIPVFRTLLDLWAVDEESRPLLALLAGYARDPLLRQLSARTLQAKQGEVVRPLALVEEVYRFFPGRFSEITTRALASRVLSSFTQSGHLEGRAEKARRRAHATPVAAAFAFYLAYLEGFRAQGIFRSSWSQLLDVDEFGLIELAQAASRRGLMDFRQVGDVYDLRFPNWLSVEEEELTRG